MDLSTDAVQTLRPIGLLERYSTVRGRHGMYNSVGVTATYEEVQSDGNSEGGALEGAIFRALTTLVEKNPMLSAVPVDKGHAEPAFFIRPTTVDLKKCVSFMERKQIASSENHRDLELDAIIENLHRPLFDLARDPPLPFWHLAVVRDADRSMPLNFTACFIFHHSILDGGSGMSFHQQLIEELSAISPAKCSSSPPATIVKAPKTELPLNLEQLRPSAAKNASVSTIQAVNSTENLDSIWSGEPPRLPQIPRFESLHVPRRQSQRFVAACKLNSTTVTAALQALVASVIFDILPLDFTKIYCGCAISLKRWLVPPVEESSMGNWALVFRSSFQRGSNDFSWSEARRARENIVKHVESRGADLGRGWPDENVDLDEFFLSKIGRKRAEAFEVSNIGVLNTSSKNMSLRWKISRVVFSQSASAISGIKVSVSMGADERLSIGFSYPEGVFDEVIQYGLVDQVYNKILKVID